MSYKDKLKAAQGSGKNYPKLEIDRHVSIREHEGKPAFAWWDSDKETMVYYNKTIKGIFIGEAIQISCYDDNLGSNGGMYQTSYYWTNEDKIVAFDNKGKVFIKGTPPDVKTALYNESGNNAKTSRVIFLLTAKGLLAISTNISINIDQMKSVEQDRYIDYEMSLSPALYSAKDTSLSKKCHEFVGKFAAKNPPKYASVGQGVLISEELAESLGVEKYAEMYSEWKEYMTKGGATDINAMEGADPGSTPEEELAVMDAHTQNKVDEMKYPVDEEDDFPF